MIKLTESTKPPKMVYICHPMRGDAKGNSEKVRTICEGLYEKQVIPFAPHIYFGQFLDDNNPVERELALLLGREMVKRCDELWIYGRIISEGMRGEVEIARQIGIPIRRFESELRSDNAVLPKMEIAA